MNGLLLRDAIINDVPSILDIVNHEILNSTVLYEYDTRTISQQQKWFAEKKNQGWPVVVAEQNKCLVGFGTYGLFRQRIAYQNSVEHSVYVHKDFRGKTIGHQLMTELVNRAKKQEYHTMVAGIDSTNQDSVEFHRKFGFEMVGTFKEVGFKFNRWLDVVFIQLMLD